MQLSEVLAQNMAYDLFLQTLYQSDFPVISTSAALNRNYLFLDTRTLKEFNTSHIENARYVGYRKSNLEHIQDVPKDTSIIVYCSIGIRSQEIDKRLKQAGYTDVYNLYGGIYQWVNDGLPVFNDCGKTNEVHAYSRNWGIWLQKGDKIYEYGYPDGFFKAFCYR